MQASVQEGTSRRGLSYKWLVATVVIFGVFMSILDDTVVNIAIPRLQTAFGADLTSVQWVVTGYILAQGVATPLTAFFTARLGLKRIYLIALTVFTVGSALCGLAWSLPVLITFRILQGAGGAFLFPLSLTLLFNEFPRGERGLAMGMIGLPALLAPALGPTLGGYILTFAGWPLIFYINVPVGIVGFIIAASLLREGRRDRTAQLDLAGFFLVAAGLASLIYGLSNASNDGWGSSTVLIFLLAGLFLLAAFVGVELGRIRQEKQPLLDLRVFANMPYLLSNIGLMLAAFVLYGGLFLLPIYLQNLRGLSAFQAGLILLPQAFAAMIASLLGGRLVDRIGMKFVVIPGLLLLAFTNWQFSLISLYTPYGWFQVLLILRGLGLGLSAQPLLVTALAEVEPRLYTQANSMTTAIRFISSSLGIAVLATLVQTQTKIHYSHLAEQVTPASPLGQFLPRLEALFVAHGAELTNARIAAIQVLIQEVQRQGYMLAMQDAFRFTLWLAFIALVVVLLIRTHAHSAEQSVSEDSERDVPETQPREEVPLGA